MRFIRFSYRRSALLLCVLVACVAVLASPGSALDGKAQWDPAVVQLYFKYFDNIDIGPGPGDYPHREMLTKVNAEFAKRVDTLMAVYRAAGGKDVGIVPGTGALRTAADQIKIWKHCRRPPPGGTQASAPATWVSDVYDDSGQPTTDPPPAGKKAHFEVSPTCERGGDKSLGLWTRVLAGRSWHNFGLAVDFGEFTAAGKYTGSKAFLKEAAWGKVWTAMADLGMLSGEFFNDPDPGHIEWYPGLLNPADAGAVGTAATNVKVGYAWKFPSTVYTWEPDPQNPASGRLKVIDFGSDGNWITVKDTRTIWTRDNNHWSGTWVTYNPAVKVFPAYIPIVRLQNWQKVSNPLAVSAVTEVEVKGYEKRDQDAEEWTDEKGLLESYPAFDVHDWQNEADVEVGRAMQHGTKSPAYKKAVKTWNNLRANSFYDVGTSAATTARHPSAYKNHERLISNGRDISRADTEGTLPGDRLSGPSFTLGWNRDTGAVGLGIELSEGVYKLISTHAPHNPEVQSSELPAGAKDQTAPPSWPY